MCKGLARPVHRATVVVQPLAHGLDRLNDFLVSTLQIYLGLAQDEGNALADQRNEITQKMSAVALLLAIPTIIFSIYGTNIRDIPVLKENWAYPFVLALTAALCGCTYWRLRRAGWL